MFPRELATALALVLHADIISSIESAIVGFFQSFINGIQSFFGTIFQSIANVVAAIFQAPVNAIESSWANFETSIAGFGFFAPFLTVIMVVAIVLLVTWVIWLVIRLSTSEGEEEVGEVEEGV